MTPEELELERIGLALAPAMPAHEHRPGPPVTDRPTQRFVRRCEECSAVLEAITFEAVQVYGRPPAFRRLSPELIGYAFPAPSLVAHVRLTSA
jgi:hypothetical protein